MKFHESRKLFLGITMFRPFFWLPDQGNGRDGITHTNLGKMGGFFNGMNLGES